MECTRLASEGMRFLDNELTPEERAQYEAHVRGCEVCRGGLAQLGRVVEFTNELRLRTPDDAFWEGYWESVYRRSERGAGFLFLILGAIALVSLGLYRAVTSPTFFTFGGISAAVVLLGLLILFVSVARERYHEHKNDPYRGVER